MDKERCVCVGIGVSLQAGQAQGPEVGMSLKNWIIICFEKSCNWSIMSEGEGVSDEKSLICRMSIAQVGHVGKSLDFILKYSGKL